ncbi:DUF1566 domain-containing protein, partial [Vibrio pacinii]|uniref:Lcl domain-containing protein n=1 Tax=Vibrio pacinii TaxID=170674 RepID=UPI00146FBB3F
GAADKDGDGFPAGQETVEGWDDNDPNNPIAAEKVENPTLKLDNTTVSPGMGVQGLIEFKVQGGPESFSTLDFADANHVNWSIVDSEGNTVVGLTPTTEGYVIIPDSESALEFASQALAMRATFLDDGWFAGQAPQQESFKVTLASVSSTQVALLKNGQPLANNEISIGDNITAQSTVNLADGSKIIAPADAALGEWSLDQTAIDLGVTIDPVTGQLDTSKVSPEQLGENGSNITVSWTGAGSLEGGHDSFVVLLSKSKVGPMCGQLNDTDSTIAKGNCLKVADDNQGNWFTSTPSIEFLQPLGYTEDRSDDNQGRTYADLHIGTGINHPEDGQFAEFTMESATDVDKQSERYCADLASLSFAGRDDWRIPTLEELQGLMEKHGEVDATLGWPASWHWTSSHLTPKQYKILSLSSGRVENNLGGTLHHVSCMSTGG